MHILPYPKRSATLAKKTQASVTMTSLLTLCPQLLRFKHILHLCLSIVHLCLSILHLRAMSAPRIETTDAGERAMSAPRIETTDAGERILKIELRQDPEEIQVLARMMDVENTSMEVIFAVLVEGELVVRRQIGAWTFTKAFSRQVNRCIAEVVENCGFGDCQYSCCILARKDGNNNRIQFRARPGQGLSIRQGSRFDTVEMEFPSMVVKTCVDPVEEAERQNYFC